MRYFPSGGSSDSVLGPASATNNQIVLFDGTTGKLIKAATGSGVVVASSGVYSVQSPLGVSSGGTGTSTLFTQGSVIFAGASGVYSQNNSNFFWDNANSGLRINSTASVDAGVFVDGLVGPDVPTSPTAAINFGGSGYEAGDGDHFYRFYGKNASVFSSTYASTSVSEGLSVTSLTTDVDSAGSGHAYNDSGINYKVWPLYDTDTTKGPAELITNSGWYNSGNDNGTTAANFGSGAYNSGDIIDYQFYAQFESDTEWNPDLFLNLPGVTDGGSGNFDVDLYWTYAGSGSPSSIVITRQINGGGYNDYVVAPDTGNFYDDNSVWIAGSPSNTNLDYSRTLSWVAPTGATPSSYRVFRDAGGGFVEYKDTLSTDLTDDNTGWTSGDEVNDLPANKQYSVDLTWVDGSGATEMRMVKQDNAGHSFTSDQRDYSAGGTGTDDNTSFTSPVVVTPSFGYAIRALGQSVFEKTITSTLSLTTTALSETNSAFLLDNSNSNGVGQINGRNNGTFVGTVQFSSNGLKYKSIANAGHQFYTATDSSSALVQIGGAGVRVGEGLTENTFLGPTTSRIEVRNSSSNVACTRLYGPYQDGTGILMVYSTRNSTAGEKILEVQGGFTNPDYGRIFLFGNSTGAGGAGGAFEFYNSRYITTDKRVSYLEGYCVSGSSTSGGGYRLGVRRDGGLSFVDAVRIECSSGTDARVGINRGSGSIQSGLHVSSNATATRSLVIQAISSQTSDLLGLLNSSGSLIGSITAAGKFFIGGSTTATAWLHLTAGSTGANTAPLKFTSGSLMSTPEVGSVEFLSDKWYGTITTGTARKEFALADDALTSGRVVITTTNGRVTDNSGLLFVSPTLTIPSATTSGASLNIPVGTAPSSPNVGDLWHDSDQKCYQHIAALVKQSIPGVLATQTSSVTVANTVTETTLVGVVTGTMVLSLNFFVVGKTIRLKARGIYSSTGNPNITIRVKLGSTTIASTGAVASGNGSSDGWVVECDITCRTTGASGVVMGNGEYSELHSAGTTKGLVDQTATINTGAIQTVSLTVEWGTASASNTITCQNLTLEVLN